MQMLRWHKTMCDEKICNQNVNASTSTDAVSLRNQKDANDGKE